MKGAINKLSQSRTLQNLQANHFQKPHLTRGVGSNSHIEAEGIWLKYSQFHRSVFPKAVAAAVPSAILSAVVRYIMPEEGPDQHFDIFSNVAAWSTFSMLVTFLVVFRTSQSYGRFWEGCTACHRMRAEWFDSCSALISFCRNSKASPEDVSEFKHCLIRLFSLLHGMALAEVEDRSDAEGETLHSIEAYSFELLDPGAFDSESIRSLLKAQHKPELLYQWLQCLVIDNVHLGVLVAPPPILTRAYQELASGMVAFHEAQKISTIPLPRPYVQACDWMLILHWIFTPLVIPQFVTHWGWALAFAAIQVFVLWGLNFTAKEIENPFGRDANDMDRRQMQKLMNQSLEGLLESSHSKVPRVLHADESHFASGHNASMMQVIENLDHPLAEAGLENGRSLGIADTCILFSSVKGMERPAGRPRGVSSVMTTSHDTAASSRTGKLACAVEDQCARCGQIFQAPTHKSEGSGRREYDFLDSEDSGVPESVASASKSLSLNELRFAPICHQCSNGPPEEWPGAEEGAINSPGQWETPKPEQLLNHLGLNLAGAALPDERDGPLHLRV